MLPAQGINLISKASPLSVVKLKYPSNSPQSSTKIPNSTPAQLHSALSPDLKINLSPCSSPRLNKTAQNWNSFNKFFKKQIQMHERELKKNPRVKLIQNTRKVISNQNPACDKYILHSTKRLKIISENMHSERSHQDRSITAVHTGPIPHLISLSEQNQQTDQRMADSMDDKRRKLSQEGKRIFKGITSRRGNRLGRFSLELEKYKSTEQQNQEDFVQHKKINLYQSLIYGEHLKTHNLAMPVTESLGGGYSRIDRSKSPPNEEIFGKKTREGLRQYVVSGFPAKKVEKSEPQVLTIHIKRPQNKFRSSLVSRQEKGSRYHPRPITISNINIFKRPNTTLVNGRNRRDSEIEPW